MNPLNKLLSYASLREMPSSRSNVILSNKANQVTIISICPSNQGIYVGSLAPLLTEKQLANPISKYFLGYFYIIFSIIILWNSLIIVQMFNLNSNLLSSVHHFLLPCEHGSSRIFCLVISDFFNSNTWNFTTNFPKC